MKFFCAIISVFILCISSASAFDAEKEAAAILDEIKSGIKIGYIGIRNNLDEAFNTRKNTDMSEKMFPVAPEDGSIITRQWFFNTNKNGGFVTQDIYDALEGTGVNPEYVEMEG